MTWLIGHYTSMYSIHLVYSNICLFLSIWAWNLSLLKKGERATIGLLILFSTIRSIEPSDRIFTFSSIQLFRWGDGVSMPIHTILSLPFGMCTLTLKGSMMFNCWRIAKRFGSLRFGRNIQRSNCSRKFDSGENLSTFLNLSYAKLTQIVLFWANKQSN